MSSSPSGRRNRLLGGLLLVAGISVTLGTYTMPAGRLAFVWYGAIVLGALQFIVGAWQNAVSVPPDGGARSVASWVKRYKTVLASAPTAVFGGSFAILTAIVSRLPKPRGTQYVVSHEVLRLFALVSGVLAVLGILTMVLPALLNILEGRSFVSFVSARHVRATKSGFLTVISVLSISGVAVSSCALVSVVSIMGGFGQDLKRKILGNNAHLMIDTQDKNGFGDWNQTLMRVRTAQGVEAATPVVSGEAMASSHTNTSGVVVRGVDQESIGTVIDLLKNIEVGKFEYLIEPDKLTRLSPEEVIGLGPGGEPFLRGPDFGGGSWFGGSSGTLDPAIRDVLRAPDVRPGVVIGRELAKTLHLYVGDELTLISPLGDLGPMGVLPRVRKFRVASIFYSGMYEYDATHVYVLLDVGQDLFSLNGRITNIDVKATNGEQATAVLPYVQEAVGRPDLRVRDWRELNKNLFSALKLERVATFIILSIAIAVASFCIICTLLLMVTEKGKEIAILKAIGASSRSIMSIFMLEGVVIGAIGTVFGVATGVALCLGLSWYGLRLDPEVYYIDRLPIAINWADYGLVALCALAICTTATIYPALAASKLHPVQALRNE